MNKKNKYSVPQAWTYCRATRFRLGGGPAGIVKTFGSKSLSSFRKGVKYSVEAGLATCMKCRQTVLAKELASPGPEGYRIWIANNEIKNKDCNLRICYLCMDEGNIEKEEIKQRRKDEKRSAVILKRCLSVPGVGLRQCTKCKRILEAIENFRYGAKASYGPLEKPEQYIMQASHELLHPIGGAECHDCRKAILRVNSEKYRKTPAGKESARRTTLKHVRKLAKVRRETQHTEEEWLDLVNKYDGRCLCCRMVCTQPNGRPRKTDITRDHVISLHDGGNDNIENIQPLCHSCNSAKHKKSIDYRPIWEDFATENPF